MKVLLIEDEEVMRRALANCFLDQPLALAADLTEAIRAMDGETFDLILADLILPPDNDPKVTLAQVRKHAGGAVVVAVTGGELDPAVVACADGAIQKTEIRNSQTLRVEIGKIVDRVSKRTPAETSIRCVNAWALAYGAVPPPKPTPLPKVSMAMRAGGLRVA